MFPTGRCVVSNVVGQDALGLGRGDGQMRGHLKRLRWHVGLPASCCTFVMIWLRRAMRGRCCLLTSLTRRYWRERRELKGVGRERLPESRRLKGLSA